jgi:hypothetical protein
MDVNETLGKVDNIQIDNLQTIMKRHKLNTKKLIFTES